MSLIFVDCEADGPCPGKGFLTEFGAVEYESRETYHAILRYKSERERVAIFLDFRGWLIQFKDSPIFVSDNPAFDWQWINHGFHHTIGSNPFGYSARRIGDFYAGVVGDYWQASKWKKFRQTKHDHNPVHDAMGNAEAFKQIMDLLRLKKCDCCDKTVESIVTTTVCPKCWTS